MKLIDRCALVLGIVGLIMIVIKCIKSFSIDIGTVSTVISIILGVISIIYTTKANNDTAKLLEDIRKENNTLTEEISHQLAKDNFGGHNIDRIRGHLNNSNKFQSEIECKNENENHNNVISHG